MTDPRVVPEIEIHDAEKRGDLRHVETDRNFESLRSPGVDLGLFRGAEKHDETAAAEKPTLRDSTEPFSRPALRVSPASRMHEEERQAPTTPTARGPGPKLRWDLEPRLQLVGGMHDANRS